LRPFSLSTKQNDRNGGKEKGKILILLIFIVAVALLLFWPRRESGRNGKKLRCGHFALRLGRRQKPEPVFSLNIPAERVGGMTPRPAAP
jgi:hypothetical protein